MDRYTPKPIPRKTRLDSNSAYETVASDPENSESSDDGTSVTSDVMSVLPETQDIVGRGMTRCTSGGTVIGYSRDDSNNRIAVGQAAVNDIDSYPQDRQWSGTANQNIGSQVVMNAAGLRYCQSSGAASEHQQAYPSYNGSVFGQTVNNPIGPYHHQSGAQPQMNHPYHGNVGGQAGMYSVGVHQQLQPGPGMHRWHKDFAFQDSCSTHNTQFSPDETHAIPGGDGTYKTSQMFPLLIKSNPPQARGRPSTNQTANVSFGHHVFATAGQFLDPYDNQDMLYKRQLYGELEAMPEVETPSSSRANFDPQTQSWGYHQQARGSQVNSALHSPPRVPNRRARNALEPPEGTDNIWLAGDRYDREIALFGWIPRLGW